MNWQHPMAVASTGQKTGMGGLGLTPCKIQPQQLISVSPWRALSASCSQNRGLCWWPLAERDGDRDGNHGITPDPVSIPFGGVGEQIFPNILPTVPIH